MNTFDVINDHRLAEIIRGAARKIIFIAPGVSQPIAIALRERLAEAGNLEVTVIVDTDPEVCRLGYGEEPALRSLKEFADRHQIALRFQAGLRIGVVVADDQVIVYAPTPKLIEAGAVSSEKPNAIVLGSGLAPTIEAAAGTDASSTLASDAEIGQVPVTAGHLASMRADLEQAPPQRFDLARQARVFGSRIQYIKLEVKGIKVANRKLKLPSDLMHADAGEELHSKLETAMRPLLAAKSVSVGLILDAEGFPAKDMAASKIDAEPYNQERLDEEYAKLQENFIHKLPKHGTVIFASTKAHFEREANSFRARLQAYLKGVKEQLAQLAEEQVHQVSSLVLQRLRGRAPAGMRPKDYPLGFGPNEIHRYVEGAVRISFQDAFSVDGDVEWRYMNIAPESIEDPGFMEAVERAIPPSQRHDLFRTFRAAEGRDERS